MYSSKFTVGDFLTTGEASLSPLQYVGWLTPENKYNIPELRLNNISSLEVFNEFEANVSENQTEWFLWD